VVVRNCILEQGIDFGEYNVHDIIVVIWNRVRENFYKELFAAVDSVVRVFYVNAYEHKNGKTMVWGKVVKFNPSTTNSFYKLGPVDDSDYAALQGNVDYKEVIRFLTREGIDAQW